MRRRDIRPTIQAGAVGCATYNGRTVADADTFYITTPIYYPNDVPHIGHGYTTVACDALARYQRLVRGADNVFFLTGTDEHGQNIQRRAGAAGVDPQAFVDDMEPKWREVWARLDISYDDYIRTTESRHHAAVVKLLNAVHDNGRDDIYLGTYEAPYCVSCEEFKTPDQINEAGNCAIHDRPLEMVAEENYFFRLSAYADRLLEHYGRRPEAVEPEIRRNEVLAFIKGGLQDFSISRTSFDWGIPIPWDPKHITYVWFDALTNYITAAGYGDDPARFARWWPAIHMIGKDILRFHAVYWPAMLMAAGVDPPRRVFAHGFLTVGGEKMSKTRATGIHPFQLVDHFGVDAYRYYFLSEIQFGQDGSFSWESMLGRYNANLANGLGNLASRVLAMIESYFGGEVPDGTQGEAEFHELREHATSRVGAFAEAMDDLQLTAALSAATDLIVQANRYLVNKAPWNLAKDEGRRRELHGVLYGAAEILRILGVILWPVMPRAMERLWSQLGMAEPLSAQRLPDAAVWGGLKPGTKAHKGEPLFPRLED
jgi:methionyl-tRNA synthetase